MIDKIKSFFVVFVISFFVFPFGVFAVTFSSQSSCYGYNHSTGAYISSPCSDYMKTNSSGKYAFCTELSKSFNKSCSKDSSWKSTGKYAIMVGYIIDTVYNDSDYSSYSAIKKYGVTTLSINTYLSNNYASSWGKYSRGSGRLSNDGNYLKNKTIKAIIDAATDKYESYKSSSANLPSVSFTVTNSTLNISGSQYISSAITTSGLAGTGASYTISASVPNGVVQICLRADGANCSSTYSVQSSDVTFYLKAVPNSGASIENQTVTVNVTGSKTTTFATSVRYDCGSGKQHMAVVSSDSVTRSVSGSAQLKIPLTPESYTEYVQHHLSAIKVDDVGALLNGSTIELWRGDPENGGVKLASNDGNGSEISWTFDRVEVGTVDPAYGYDYYIVETSAPAGYQLNKINHFFKAGDITGTEVNDVTCYNTGDSESKDAVKVDDLEYCNQSNYIYRCQSDADSTDIKDMTEGGNCNFEVVTDDNDTSSGDNTGETSGETSGDTSGENTEDTSGSEQTDPVVYNKVCWNISANTSASDSYCENQSNYIKVTSTNGNIVVTHTNKKNTVLISKKALTGDDEVAGATLKICTKESYDSKEEDCEVAKTIDDVELSWTSGYQVQEWHGLNVGDYYIVETTPPSGYILTTTATEFSIDEEGKVTTGGTVLEEGSPIVIKNTLSTITVSKQDVATSSELPGATISICSTYKDDDGNIKMYVETDPDGEEISETCIPAVLEDGTSATWVSNEEPHEVIGLPAGTYYLVEKIAPDGYSSAESIMFTLKEDGTLVDKDGNLLKNSKLIMYDSVIQELETGLLPLYVVIVMLIIVIGIGGGSYYFLNKNKKHSVKKYKIRGRKIHKFYI